MPFAKPSHSLCAVLTALLLVLSAVPVTHAALHATTTAPDEMPCMHDKIAAAQAADPAHQATYVRIRYPNEAVSTDASMKVAMRGPSHTFSRVAYRDFNITPRRGAQPASVEFTINGNASAPAEAVGGAADDSTWQPIRIRAFFEDLLDESRYCTAVGQYRPDFGGSTVECTSTFDILTTKKRDILMNTLVPTAIQMHMERLKVQPVPAGAAIVVGRMAGSWCGSFTVPASHRSTGVTDADHVVYVGAGPTSTPTSFIAWAIGCQLFPGTDRPAVSAIYFNPRYLVEEADETPEEIAVGGDAVSLLDSRIRIAAHELLHALGFSYSNFQRAGMVSYVAGIRGKPAVAVLNSSSVRAAAMAHYGCTDSAVFPGMELEDQGAGGTSGSHWKRRNARDEIMSPIANYMRYTAMTIAAMEDLGYYKVSYDKAEYMGWGNQAGCTMLTEKCISDRTSVTSTTPSVFCSESSSSSSKKYCTRDRLRIGRCYVTTYNMYLPTYMQYYPIPTVGGGEGYVDYCPTVQAYSNAGCYDGTVGVMPGSVTGRTARCFSADDDAPLVVKNSFAQQHAICATVQCNFTTQVYHVQFSGAGSYVPCVPGTTVQPAASSPGVFEGGGRVHCPPFFDVCGANPRASRAVSVVDPNETEAARQPNSRAAAAAVLLVLASLQTVMLLL